MNTINRFLIDSSKANPEKLALIDDDSKFTFLELEEKVMKFSSFLNQFDEKSVISLLFENTSEFVISYLGIINSGCVAHLIPTGISQSNLKHQIMELTNQTVYCAIPYQKNFDLGLYIDNFTNFVDFTNFGFKDV